jgi:hypothetical protein
LPTNQTLAGLTSRWIRPRSWAAASLGNLSADAQHFRRRQPTLTLQQAAQRLATKQLHDQKGEAAVLTDLVNGDDVFVLHGRHGPGLAQEAAAGGLDGGQGRPQRLQSHQALQLRVLGLQDHPHATGSQHLEDPVGPQPAQLLWSLCRGQKRVQLGGDFVPRPHVERGRTIAAWGGWGVGGGRLLDRCVGGRRPEAFDPLDQRVEFFGPGRLGRGRAGAQGQGQAVVGLDRVHGL